MSINLNIKSIEEIIKPDAIISQLIITTELKQKINCWRNEIKNIINKKDNRLLVVVGPCSIHDIDAALDYARKLKRLSDLFQDRIRIVMRVYFEKPRTTVGWKGLINDPFLDNTFKINQGLYIARKLLIDINKIGLPVGCEFLDVFTPQYYSDLVSWVAIGARTTESQLHRQLASGLSMPVGFKNGTTGNIEIARDAIIAASASHVFLGINNLGVSSRISTHGNKNVHIILRGSKTTTNYDKKSVKHCVDILKQAGINTSVVVDLSHGNSNKIYKNQILVADAICQQLLEGNNNLIGIMIESNINEGKQKLNNIKDLKYGVSITDGCINIKTTEKVLEKLFMSLKQRFNYIETNKNLL